MLILFLISVVCVSPHLLGSDGIAGSLNAADIEQHSVNHFNDTYTDALRTGTANTYASKGNIELASLIRSSFPCFRGIIQRPYIAQFTGEDTEAIDQFKKLPAKQALERGRQAQLLYEGTDHKLSKSNAFLLKKKSRNLCCDIVANTVEKETANGLEHIVEVDADTYNAIAYLPPHIKKAMGERYVVVNRTFAEKLLCTGTYCLIGGIAGGLGGGAIGGITHLPDIASDILLDSSVRLATTAATSVLDTVQKQPELKTLYDKAVVANEKLSNSYHAVENSPLAGDDAWRQYRLLQLPKDAIKTTQELHNEYRNLPKSVKKQMGKNAMKDLALDSCDIIVHDPRAFDSENAKKGAVFGAAIGGSAGLLYGYKKAQKPLIKEQIRTIGRNTTMNNGKKPLCKNKIAKKYEKADNIITQANKS